ncbi:hypothetical protein BT96DRAFT_922743 [Gymnopus androsaceus JB14]|uniref:S-adenosyl-L-methionine-dependent methyltransferase n=1 Tax=Gymnopus androsaceus JB14 TaxID=1447944 RepID=A0A6A4HB50_9AGAR|nr:hypothetical protein BT96DRAFT_922743 [Gymnopus androsaceus JB14]
MYDSSNPSICAPSAGLPPLSKLLDTSSGQIYYSLDNLRQLYGRQPATLPPKLSLPIRRHQQLIHDDSVPDSGYASAEEEENDLDAEDVFVTGSGTEDESFEVLRADPLERAFAIKWVTGFIARSDTWASEDGIDDVEADRRTEAVENATKLLSLLLSSEQLEEEEDCSVTRSFQFLVQGGTVIEAELNDAPLLNEDHTCVGLQSWASSIVLSEQICADPSRFSLSSSNKGIPLRILELGAGTGLLSIVAAKLLQPPTSTSIFATDYHPDVLVNLRANIATNFPGLAHPISVHQLDWEFPDYSAPMDEPFDLILAADVVYHPDHARWIKACAERLLLRPNSSSSSSSSEGGVFWLMMALRISGRHEGMFHTVEDIFPDAPSSSEKELDVSKEVVTDEWQLAVLEKIELGKLKGVGRADERGYLLFKIGWIPC